MNQTTENMIRQQQKTIEQERQQLIQDRAKLDKRVDIAMAEERLKLRSEFDKLVNEQGQSCDKRKKELEDDFAIQREENNSRVIALVAENGQFSMTVEKQKATIEDRANKLEKSIEQCDILERAQKSIKAELLDREKELEMLKREFALNSKSKEDFKQRFAEMYRVIEYISLSYFNDIDGKDLEIVHEKLVAADRCFASVPVDDSDDSRNLRVAHAQRIISDAICEIIWKPFRSEFTLLHPEVESFLAKISDALEKSSHGGRITNHWNAFTTRGLQLLLANSAAPDIKEPLRPTNSGRADGVASKVFSVLSPLISPSQDKALRSDLLHLTNLSIDTWNDAQTGELKVTISPSLKPSHREEWRSQKLDPAWPPGSYDEIGSDIMSETHPRIFTLFPRIAVWEVVGPIKSDAGPPGSWPSESDQGPRRIETCIHPGVGLPECSPLVVRGKEEQEQRNEYLSKAIETAKKELHSNRRLTHGRRESTASLTSPPSSPSQVWKNGGATFSQRSDL